MYAVRSQSSLNYKNQKGVTSQRDALQTNTKTKLDLNNLTIRSQSPKTIQIVSGKPLPPCGQGEAKWF